MQGIMEGVPSTRDYKGGFKAKDMAERLAAALASQSLAKSALPMTQQAAQLYQRAGLLI